MLTLVFSKEPKVSEAVTTCFKELYMRPEQDKTSNLLRLIENASIVDLTCVEELIKMSREEIFWREVFFTLWQQYQNPTINYEAAVSEEDI